MESGNLASSTIIEVLSYQSSSTAPFQMRHVACLVVHRLAPRLLNPSSKSLEYMTIELPLGKSFHLPVELEPESTGG
jgi:hypothetical protein